MENTSLSQEIAFLCCQQNNCLSWSTYPFSYHSVGRLMGPDLREPCSSSSLAPGRSSEAPTMLICFWSLLSLPCAGPFTCRYKWSLCLFQQVSCENPGFIQISFFIGSILCTPGPMCLLYLSGTPS